MAEERRPLRSQSVTKLSNTGDDMTVSELAKLMKTQFATYQQNTVEEIRRLEHSFQSEMNKLRSDIALDLDNMRKESTKTTTTILNTVSLNKNECLAAVDRSMRANDLIVNGVPYVAGESLSNYFAVWCRSLGYTDEDIPLTDVKRLVRGTPTAGVVYLIMIQFAITTQRNEFYGRYLRSRKLSLMDIGFSSNQRIFVNENLEPATRELRTKALQMKKKGQLSGVYTRMGILYVKKTTNDREKPILSEDDLHTLR